mmetsp:Transcript_122757/g.343629  ORF Transcript_122757/g.343629 Transcript_122757/m.343629 type:complete len:382 (-) Transcript_122757:80-1225(-)
MSTPVRLPCGAAVARRSAERRCSKSEHHCQGSLIELQDLADVPLATHYDRTTVMDVLRHHLEDAAELPHVHTGARGATRLLGDERHREALVEHPKLAFGRLLVRRVQEDAAVQQRAVHVRDHGAHVPRRVAVVFASLDVAEDRRVPLQRVPLVAGEDFLAAVSGHLHVRDEEELPKGGVEGEALHAGAEGDDELRGRAVHAVAGHDDVCARAEDVVHRARLLGPGPAPVHGEDGAHAHIAVDVRRAVEGVKGHAEGPALVHVLDEDRLFLLLGDEEAADAAVLEAVHPDGVGDDVQLFHVVSRRVLHVCKPIQVASASLLDCVGADLASMLHGIHQQGQLLITRRALDDVLRHGHRVQAVLHHSSEANSLWLLEAGLRLHR